MPATFRQWRILTSLIAAHVVAGLWLTWRVRSFRMLSGTFEPLLLGLVLAGAGLVGLWGVIGPATRMKWWTGATCASLFLCSELQTAVRGWGDTVTTAGSLILVFAPMCLTAILLAILRRRGVHLTHADEISATSAREAIQFSISQLLLLTLAVAILLSVMRGLHARSPAVGITLASATLTAVLIGGVFAGQTLTSLWATLGLGRWFWRLAVPFSVAALGGMSIGYAEGGGRQNYDLAMQITVLQTAVVVATLVVIRLLGYRLVRAPRHSSPQHEERESLEIVERQ